MRKMNRFFVPIFIFALLVILQCKQSPTSDDFAFRIIPEAIENKNHPYFLDTKMYPEDRKSLPIGVFDSGTGGLSVLNTILELDEFNNTTHEPGSDSIPDFENEHFIYLADEANMPYGKYFGEGKADFLKELVLKDVLFLLGNRYYMAPDEHKPILDKESVKSIVIACNTATAYGLETATEAMDHWGLGVNVTGIIEAGARSALSDISSISQDHSVVGVMATEGTCASEGYPNSIMKFASSLTPGKDIKVTQQPGIGLAGAIDGDINYVDSKAVKARSDSIYFGPDINHPDYPVYLKLWDEYNFENGNGLFVTTDSNDDTISVQLNSVANYIRYMVTHLLNTATKEYPDYSMNTAILGCTHYPYVEQEILKHFLFLKNLKEKYDQVIPEDIALIDPARALAISLYQELVEKQLFGENSNNNSSFYISVPNYLLIRNQVDKNGEFPYTWKYGRDHNTLLEYVKRVPFSDQWIDESIQLRMKKTIPTTYDIITFN